MTDAATSNRASWFKAFIYAFLYGITISIIASTFLIKPIDRTPFPIIRLIIVFFATVLLTKYFVYMVLSPVYDVLTARREMRMKREIALYRPSVSVIIPAWNEEVGIIRTVESVLSNTYERIEAIVVNDGSTDGSDRIVRDFLEKYSKESHPGKTLLYKYKENGGKSSALNAGLAMSSGEIIISIDADCYVTSTAVENFVKCFVDPRVMAAVGNVKIGNTKTILGTVQYLEFLFSFYFKKADSLLNTIYIIGGAAGAFRREVFDKVGPYTLGLITEDIELSVRIQAAGMKIVYASEAIVYTEGATDLNGLMKQRLRWKRGRFQTFWKYRNLFFSNEDRHNKILTFGILPLALVGDIQLFLEIFFLLFLYFYSIYTHSFASFISGIIVVSSMFAVQIFDDKENATRISFILLAPIGWLLFYVSTFVEHNALLESIMDSVRGKEAKWQRWQRKGVTDS